MNVLVADDEAIARARMVRLLAEIEGVEVSGECENVDQVLERVRAGGIDVLLLDVQMPGLTGIDALALLPEDGPSVILCTAHAEYAVRAFDEGADDYLLKPVEIDRLRKALDRVRQRRSVLQSGMKAREIQKLAIQTKQGIVLVDPTDITHAVLDGPLVSIVTTSTEYLTDFSLQELERKLPETFLRVHRRAVHRRAIVNLDHVSRLEPIETGGFIARTAQGKTVEVSRQSARDLRKWLGLRG
jgi:two-component system LytT family response regulator